MPLMSMVGLVRSASDDIKGFYVQGNCVHGCRAYREFSSLDLNQINTKNESYSVYFANIFSMVALLPDTRSPSGNSS